MQTFQLFFFASASAAAEILRQSSSVSIGRFFIAGPVLDLLEGAGILDGREVARVAALGQRLDRAAQRLARTGLGQQRHEMHRLGPRDGAELLVHGFHDLVLATCAFWHGVLHHREGQRHLTLDRVGNADDRALGDVRDAC